MKKWTKRVGATTPMMAVLFGLACHDAARLAAPEERIEAEALDAFEADILASGATPVVAKVIRETIQLEDGQVLEVAPAGSLEGDSKVVRRISLPDGREALVVWERGR